MGGEESEAGTAPAEAPVSEMGSRRAITINPTKKIASQFPEVGWESMDGAYIIESRSRYKTFRRGSSRVVETDGPSRAPSYPANGLHKPNLAYRSETPPTWVDRVSGGP